MKELFAEVPTPAGKMRAFVTYPEQDGPFPAVVIYMDFWGIREELYNVARWLGAVGFYCVVPDLYYRQGTVVNEIHDEHGKMVSLDRLDQATHDKVLAPLRNLTDTEAMDDTQSLLSFLDGQDMVRPGPKGSVGFCLGGRLAMRAACRFPEQFKASASLHGSSLVTDREDSPYRSVHNIQGEFYCGFAEHDPYTSPDTVDTLVTAMKKSPAKYRYQFHKGAAHGYALPNRDIHDRNASLRDWEIILAMYQRQLAPYRA
jgi:carboxymethylenebutenolidase